MKLKDYPHLMMELFEVAAGNWCVAGTAVFRTSDFVSPILYLGSTNAFPNDNSLYSRIPWPVIGPSMSVAANFILFSSVPCHCNTVDFGSNLTLSPPEQLVHIWSSLVIIPIKNFMLHHRRCKANMRHVFLFLMSTNPPIFRQNSKVERCVSASELIRALIVMVRWHR